LVLRPIAESAKTNPLDVQENERRNYAKSLIIFDDTRPIARANFALDGEYQGVEFLDRAAARFGQHPNHRSR
jgi:hypothetical protein